MENFQDETLELEKTENQDFSKKLTLDDIFRDYDGELGVEEYDWGEPIGKEFW